VTSKLIFTAGASGIGLAIARHFTEQGALVAICDVDDVALKMVADEFCLAAACDMTNADAVSEFVDQAVDQMGVLTTVIANAGTAGPTTLLEDISPQAWVQTIAVNLTGQFTLCRSVIPYLKAQTQGAVILMSSAAGRLGLPILPTGIETVSKFAREHGTEDQLEMPEIADGILGLMCNQPNGLDARVDGLTKLIEQHALLDTDAQRLMRITGIGPITASAVVATICDAKQFETGRDLAAWLGLTPLNKSSGGKERLGHITKKGDRYIRKLLIVGMTSRALMARNKPEKANIWTAKLFDQKPFRQATVAMANKSARII